MELAAIKLVKNDIKDLVFLFVFENVHVVLQSSFNEKTENLKALLITIITIKSFLNVS
jgi:hypothetical protein